MTTAESTPRMLVVDDEVDVIPIVVRLGRQVGFEVATKTGGAAALAFVPEFRPHVVVVDLRMPDVGGLDVLKAIRGRDPECSVILMTGSATIDSAIEAVRLGALDYVSKPLDLGRMRALLTGVLDGIRQRETLLLSESDAAGRIEFYGMIGRSAVMQQLFDSIRRLAPHVHTVLVTGETGTGKELVARALYQLGPRRARPFITVNCSAVVETLFESELFGHVRGAFTGATESKVGLFEHADGGTLFLDEAGDLPLGLQPKLLRAVESGEVQRVGAIDARRADVHVIAATNRDLRAEAAAGRFRPDLFYRLGVIEIHLVPLRERREDIAYLTARFVKEFAARFGRAITGVSAGAERLLQEALWPGNIRELRNVLERACILCEAGLLTERDLGPALAVRPLDDCPAISDAALPESVPDAPGLLSTAQKRQIERVLRDTKGNKAEAARLLGVSRRSLYRWIERLDLKE